MAEGVTPGTLEEAFVVGAGRGVMEWVLFGATAVPVTVFFDRGASEEDWPLWVLVTFGIALVSLLLLSMKVANAVEARKWALLVGVRPSDEMVMALTAESLLIWNRSHWERTPHRLILRLNRHGLSGKRCWGFMAFELTTAEGHRLIFNTDSPNQVASDRLLAKLHESPVDQR